MENFPPGKAWQLHSSSLGVSAELLELAWLQTASTGALIGVIVLVQKAFETLGLHLSYRHGLGFGSLQWSLPEIFLQSWQEKMLSLQKELLEGEEGKEKEPFPSFV